MKVNGRWRLWIALGVVGALVLSVAVYTAWHSQPVFVHNVPAAELTVRPTRFLVQRGRYLFHAVSGCAGCHSPRQEQRFAMPVEEARVGAGGQAWGVPSAYRSPVFAPAVTQTALKTWTDGQVLRAFTAGVAADGRALAHACPWPNYQRYDALDAQAVLAYLRTLPPLPATAQPRPRLRWFAMAPASPARTTQLPNKPLAFDTLGTGRYLLGIAACSRCHGNDMAGGQSFALRGGARVYATNLTPDTTTGIGAWNEARFLQRFQRFQRPGFQPAPVHANGYNSPMPWLDYAQLTDADLRAMYRYLRTLTPIERKTPPFEPAH